MTGKRGGGIVKKLLSVLKINKLLLYYILVVITFIFKALHFTDAYKDLVDALFYSTNMITMLSTAMQKANTQ